MPSITEQSTIDTIARVFCGEGKRNKAETLRIVGYKDSYCDNHGTGIVYTNDRVIAAIARIDAKQAEIGNRTVESLDKMYQDGFDVAKTQKNSTGMATNTAGIARLYGFGGDKAGGLPEGLTINVNADKPETGPILAKEAV